MEKKDHFCQGRLLSFDSEQFWVTICAKVAVAAGTSEIMMMCRNTKTLPGETTALLMGVEFNGTILTKHVLQ